MVGLIYSQTFNYVNSLMKTSSVVPISGILKANSSYHCSYSNEAHVRCILAFIYVRVHVHQINARCGEHTPFVILVTQMLIVFEVVLMSVVPMLFYGSMFVIHDPETKAPFNRT